MAESAFACRIVRIDINTTFIGASVSNRRGEDPTDGIQIDRNNRLTLWEENDLLEYEDNERDLEGPGDICGSLYPVAVNVSKPSCSVLIVTIKIMSDDLLNTPLQIYGENDRSTKVITPVQHSLNFRKTGIQEVDFAIRPPWAKEDIPWGLAGNIAWKLTMDGRPDPVGLNSSRLEFYALRHEKPKLLGDKPIPVSLLRNAVLPRTSPNDESTWEEYCCSLAFHGFGFQYDVNHGASRFLYTEVYTGGRECTIFDLSEYIELIGTNEMVNCYDQAAVMAVLLELSPKTSSTEILRMQPFGFIQTTVLVGRGATNNPLRYWQALGNTPWQPVWTSQSPPEDRAAFGSHCFVRLATRKRAGGIVEACCGPHTGNENLSQFIHNSIDTTHLNPLVEVGTSDNVRGYTINRAE